MRGFYGLKLCLLLVSLLFYFATSNAQTSPDPQQIADTMVRLCVGGGHTQATSGGGTGGADLSLRSLDVKGNVKGELKISKSNAEGLVNGIDNALSQVAADQADKVRLCLQPVRERLLDVLLPAPPVAPEPAVTLQGSPTAPLGETTYYDVMSQNAVRGEWSVGGFANNQLFVVKPLGPSHRIYVEPTDRMQVGQTFVIRFTAYNQDGKSTTVEKRFVVVPSQKGALNRPASSAITDPRQKK
jgi:hypothetical protein